MPGAPAATLRVERWGCVPHGEAVARMDALAAKVAAGRAPDSVLLLEHPAVITLGVRGEAARDLRTPAADLARAGITIATATRGGQATLHSPGQLVVWFVSRLAGGRRNLPEFLARVESLLVDAVAEFGVAIRADRRDVGLWAESTPGAPRRKMGSIGLCFSAGVTTHGAALNVTNDLALFDHIVPCGLRDVTMVRLADLLPPDSPHGGGPAPSRALSDTLADAVARLAPSRLAR